MLRTRVFELSGQRYSDLSELARAMGISMSQAYRVRNSRRGINEKFIIGAIRAFPEYNLDDLFYVASDHQTTTDQDKGYLRDNIVAVGNVSRGQRDLVATEGVQMRIETMNSGNKERELSYAEIARTLGISHERVRQIAMRQRLNRQSKVIVSSRVNEVATHTDTMLTTREVAQLLNVHVNTVRRWSNQDILKSYRLGTRGDRRFKREDVAAFLKGDSNAHISRP